MADWNDLTAYLKDTFKIINEQDGMLAMGWNLEDGRSQRVLVFRQEDPNGDQWAEITTAVSDDLDDLEAACRIAQRLWCGGIRVVGLDDRDMVMLSDCFPLENLDVNEVMGSLATVVQVGDDLERALSGGQDKF